MTLYEEIRAVVSQIPYGQIASYGQVARAAGKLRGARLVGWALRALPPDSAVPWQRVVNQKAQISIVNPKVPKTLQRARLEEEGLTVIEKDGWYVVQDPPWFSFPGES